MTVVTSSYVRQQNDLYQTEPWATRALLRNLSFLRDQIFQTRTIVWEPFAGNHLMADVIREAGHRVVTSDIRNYDRGHDFLMDFLGRRQTGLPLPYHAIIS